MDGEFLALVLATTGTETGPLSKREEIDLSHWIAPTINAAVAARQTTARARNIAAREKRRLTPPPPPPVDGDGHRRPRTTPGP